METQLCPRCQKPILAEDKICSDCGEVPPQREAPPISPPARKKLLEVGLLVEVLIIVGFVVLGTLAVYSLVSSVSSRDWRAFYEGITTPEPASPAKPAAPVPSTKPNEKVERQKQPEAVPSDLSELPSTAPVNAYMALQQGVTARRSNDVISFICVVENISDAVCSGAGVEVSLYDADSNCIGLNSVWVYREIQPGERVQLVFGSQSSPDVRAFCVTKVDGQLDAAQLSTGQTPSEASAVVNERPSATVETYLDEKPAEQDTVSILSESDVSLPHGLTLLDGVVEERKERYSRQLQGRVRNDSKEKYRNVRIRFVIYDNENNRISTTMTSTKDFEVGTVWSFSAPVVVSSHQIINYRISSVTVY